MKHLDKMTKFCFAGCLLSLSAFTLACNPGQGSGQCGYYDNSGYHNAPIGSYNGGNYSEPTRVITRVVKLPDRFGAVAVSSHGIGSSHDRPSLKEAETAALNYCKEFGTGCQIAATIRNGCIAVAQGKNSKGWGIFTKTGEYEDQAVSKTLALCKSMNYTECEIAVSSCSIPTPP